MDSIGRLVYVLKSVWQDESNRGQRLRRLLFFFGWQARKRVSRTPVQSTLFNGFNLEVWPDCDIGPSALYYSVPNFRAISFLRKNTAGGTFIDVGANIGMVSLLLADRVEHAILFEPNPLAVERAKRNLRANGLDFQVFQQALSDSGGTVIFEDLGGSSCRNRTVDGFETESRTIIVDRTTFDSFWEKHGTNLPSVSSVKIDVEGHENSVLRGMRDFLRQTRPRILMFEYLARTNIRTTLEIFDSVGYFVFELSAEGPRPVTTEVSPLQDLFACPKEIYAHRDFL